jgi:hypothetical protein
VTRTAAFVVHEWRLARRSNRYWVTILLQVALVSAPAVLLALRQGEQTLYGPGSFMDYLSFTHPFALALGMLILGSDGIVREQGQRSWTVLTLAEMSNAGYLLRRWVALLAVTLPWMVVPLLVTAGAAAVAGIPPLELLPFVPLWLARTLPVAVAMAALGLGLGTLGGGLFTAAALFALVTLVGAPLLDRMMVPSGMRWEGFSEWLGSADFQTVAFTVTTAPARNYVRAKPTADIPVDPAEALSYLVARGGVAFGLSMLALALAALFLRRTVADTPPWTVSPKHPLRSFLGLFNRLRQHFRPEPRPALQDLALLVAGVAMVGLAVGWKVDRHRHYQALAESRYTAELAEAPAATPRGIALPEVKVRGRLENSGHLQTEVVWTVERQSPEAAGDALSFSLAEGLRVVSLTSSRGTAVVDSRPWDRLAVRLDPPLEPGERRTLHFALEGTPRTHDFRLRGISGEAFASRFQRQPEIRFARDLADLTHSKTALAATSHQVQLTAEQLLPVPRFTPWTLSEPGEAMRATGMEVQEETDPAMAWMEMELEGPPGLHLVSACGTVTPPGQPLRERCRAIVNTFRILGAELEVLRQGALNFAVFRLHRDAAAFHLPTVDRVAELLEDAWPGETPLPPVTLLEWTPPPQPASASGKLWSRRMIDSGADLQFRPMESFGNVVILPDLDVLRRQPIPPEVLVGQTLAGQLLMRRPLEAEHRGVLRFLLEHLVKRRLGLVSTLAVIPPQRNPEWATLRLWPRELWIFSSPARPRAVFNYLINRVGEEPFYAIVEEFLARGATESPEPGTLYELLALVEARRGLDLSTFWRDFLEGQALPDPVLEGVRFQNIGGRWRVTGTVRNAGSGEVLCPVLLTTDLSPREMRLEIPDGGSVPFTLETPYRPQAVVLDPRGECLRFQGLAARDRLRVEFAQ